MIEAIVAEAAHIFLPALLTFITAKVKDGASTDVAIMQSIAKLEDIRAKGKFPNFKGSDPG